MSILNKISSKLDREPVTTTAVKAEVTKVASQPKVTDTFTKMAMVKAAAEINKLSTEVQELKKTAQATDIALRLLQDGQISVSDFPEKVAELRTKDLAVVEQAIKMAYAGVQSGMITGQKNYGITDPLTAAILDLN